MADNVSKEIRKKTMQAVKAKNTKLEDLVLKELWKRGIRFRKNVAGLAGKPDLSLKKYKIVVFIDSCFWHGCDFHLRMPETNKEYWTNKISKNKARDKKINEYYKCQDWNIMRVWEHQLKKDYENTILEILTFIKKAKTNQR
jgi:DNA mismatch endonuclease, patch repair protein